MTPEQKTLVQATWGKVVPIADQAASMFYDRLFAIDPGARVLFRATDMAQQRKKLLQVLSVAIVGVLSSVDKVDPSKELIAPAIRRWIEAFSDTRWLSIETEEPHFPF